MGDQVTEEQLRAKAMLLGFEYLNKGGIRQHLFRERLGHPAGLPQFSGCAYFRYYNAITMDVIIEHRSEVDNVLVHELNRRGLLK